MSSTQWWHISCGEVILDSSTAVMERRPLSGRRVMLWMDAGLSYSRGQFAACSKHSLVYLSFGLISKLFFLKGGNCKRDVLSGVLRFGPEKFWKNDLWVSSWLFGLYLQFSPTVVEQLIRRCGISAANCPKYWLGFFWLTIPYRTEQPGQRNHNGDTPLPPLILILPQSFCWIWIQLSRHTESCGLRQ